LLPILRKNNVNKSVIEVISNNEAAIHLYQNQGFVIKREVVCIKGKLNIKN
jgi:ribosomal protein S18 acetylase RimI-like enzyme